MFVKFHIRRDTLRHSHTHTHTNSAEQLHSVPSVLQVNLFVFLNVALEQPFMFLNATLLCQALLLECPLHSSVLRHSLCVRVHLCP